jgi:hypothetical protein
MFMSPLYEVKTFIHYGEIVTGWKDVDWIHLAQDRDQ